MNINGSESAAFVRNIQGSYAEKYGIWFKSFLGLEKYGKKKAEYGKIFAFPDFCPHLGFYKSYKECVFMAAV